MLARYRLPGRSLQSVIDNPNIFQGFSGGGYFYLDNADRAVIGTSTGHVFVVADNGRPASAWSATTTSAALLRKGESLNSALPGQHGLLWFVAKQDGVVGTLNLDHRCSHVIRLGSGATGEIENSFAVGEDGGVYIATDRSMYRFNAAATAQPQRHWHVGYPNVGR